MNEDSSGVVGELSTAAGTSSSEVITFVVVDGTAASVVVGLIGLEVVAVGSKYSSVFISTLELATLDTATEDSMTGLFVFSFFLENSSFLAGALFPAVAVVIATGTSTLLVSMAASITSSSSSTCSCTS